MTKLAASVLFRSTLAAGTLALAACAPAPIYQPAPTTVAASPNTVAQAPERFTHADVIWGGRVVEVRNLADRSEIEILAYPLDSSQRPKLDNNGGWGRFIAVMPGYVEAFDFPAGALITLSGRIDGSRASNVGEASYVFPLVSVTRSHVWTADEMRSGHPNINFGLGIGVGIR